MKGESSRTPRSLNPRSRSQREEYDVLRSPVFDTDRESSWDKIPPELLHEILMRIETSESTWPLRKHVIACAGVCRSWRNFMKEIVEASVVPRVMTFPISVKQPGPRGSLLQCFIKRNRIAQTYHLYLGLTQGSTDGGKFLLAARRFKRTTCNEYLISLDPYNISKGNDTYVGKLRSNFLGTKFTIYDGQPVHVSDMVLRNCSTHLMGSKPKVLVGNYPVAHISYDLNTMGPRGPRSMRCIMDSIPASTIKPGSVDPLQTFGSKSHRKDPSGIFPARKEEKLVLKNKSPRWHERLQCWCLNFRGRVTVASVKNFQLSVSPDDGRVGPEHEEVILQFGKAGKELFTMDYRYPISAFQAFAICLSSFDAKIACE